MTPDQDASRTQDLQAAAREMDFENYTKQFLNKIQVDQLELTEQELLADKGWVYASKVLSEWNNGTPFGGTDEEAAKYGLSEMSGFNYSFFNVDWGDEDNHGLVSYMLRLSQASDHEKFAFAYLSEVFDAKDPTVKGFFRALGKMTQDPASIASVAMPLALIAKWGGKRAAKAGVKYTLRKWAQDVISKRMGAIGAVDGAMMLAFDDWLRQDVEEQYYPTLGREVPTDRTSVLRGYDRTATASLTGAAAGYMFVRAPPALWNLGKRWLPDPGTTQLNMGVGPSRVATGASEGQYIGAPEGVNTPQLLSALTRRITNATKEGEAGRYWYERSGETILRAVGGDHVAAEKISQLIGIFSSTTPVGHNLQYALQAFYQHKAGMPIHSGKYPTAMSKRAKDVLDGIPWEGRKTNTFYNNLMKVIDPERHQGVTVDVWMMRAFGYTTKKRGGGVGEADAPTPAQYEFVEKKIFDITENLNKNLGPDDAPWEPQQVQAAIWVATKAKRPVKGHPEGVGIDAAKFDYADALADTMAQISWETIPGRTTDHLPEMFDAPYAQQVEYHVAQSKAFLDDDGNDIIAKELGLLSPGDFEAPGHFEGKVSPGTQTEVYAPRQYKGPDYGKVDASIEKLINRYAAIRGILLKQDGMGWHRPFWSKKVTVADADGVEIRLPTANSPLGRQFTEAEIKEVAERLQALAGHGEYNPISTPNGVRIIHFDYLKEDVSNIDFQALVKSVVDDMEFKNGEDYTAHQFASQSGYVGNDWQGALNGEGYMDIGGEGRPDIQRQIRDLVEKIQPRVDDIDAEFASRYGWTINDSINATYRGGTPK